MIRFAKWLENKESSALSPPQHKADEIDKSLDDIVAKELMQLAMDMEVKGKGSRGEVLKAIQRVVGSVKSQPQDQPQGQAPQGQAPQGQAPQGQRPDISNLL